jgi:DNA-binding transcriptional LysR family regulator
MEPGIQVEIVVANHASDLRRREADIAIRNFWPTEPDLIVKKIGDADAVLYTTPDYITKIGNPKKPYDLRHAEFAKYGSWWHDVQRAQHAWAWLYRGELPASD